MQRDLRTALVTQIVRSSFVDGPGLRTVVFFKGCPLRCEWCHNPETQSSKVEISFDDRMCIDCGSCAAVCSFDAIMDRESGRIDRSKCTQCMKCIEECPCEALEQVGQLYSVASLMEEIRKDKKLFENSGGGITLSGGEPLAQDAKFLLELVQACKKEGIHTSIDTCGVATWETIREVAPFVDLFLYDVKHTTRKDLGCDTALANLSRIGEIGGRVWIRIPLIPTVNAMESELCNIGEIIKSLPDGVVQRVNLLPFHRYSERKYEMIGRRWKMDNVQELCEEEVIKCAATLSAACGIGVTIGG